MEIKIKVKTGQNKSKIVEIDGKLSAYLKSDPKGGRANEELIKLLAIIFKTDEKNIKIIKGQKTTNKTVEVK